MFRRKNLQVFLFLLFILVILTGCSNDHAPSGSATPVASETDEPKSDIEIKQSENSEPMLETKPASGYMAPNFVFYTDKGENSLEELRGKPVFLIFWASW